MMISRETTRILHFILDQLLPPLLRDSKIFMYPLFRLALKKNARLFMDFKKYFISLSQSELDKYYKQINKVCLKRQTNINKQCLRKINSDICGNSILDVGSGNCYLSNILCEKYKVTAVDVDIEENCLQISKNLSIVNASILALPFACNEFDTVICAHTLEHIKNIDLAINELRRVVKRKLIIVVPKQRPYKYTFDAHINFFPYQELFLNAIEPKNPYTIEVLGGDIYYIEHMDNR